MSQSNNANVVKTSPLAFNTVGDEPSEVIFFRKIEDCNKLLWDVVKNVFGDKVASAEFVYYPDYEGDMIPTKKGNREIRSRSLAEVKIPISNQHVSADNPEKDFNVLIRNRPDRILQFDEEAKKLVRDFGIGDEDDVRASIHKDNAYTGKNGEECIVLLLEPLKLFKRWYDSSGYTYKQLVDKEFRRDMYIMVHAETNKEKTKFLGYKIYKQFVDYSSENKRNFKVLRPRGSGKTDERGNDSRYNGNAPRKNYKK